MINQTQLREVIIKPTLDHMDMWSLSAENLLMGTAAVESGGGYFLKQMGNGPARGIYQMEPNTHDDIVGVYFLIRPMLGRLVRDVTSVPKCDAEYLYTNLAYMTAMARIHYWRVSEPLPEAYDIEGLAGYWKRYYNTVSGAGSAHKFIEAYQKVIGIA